MERYKCRFCFKRFFNGRALGDHMRSHIANLNDDKFNVVEEEEEEERPSQLSDETESDTSSSSSSFEEITQNGFNGFIKKTKMNNQDFTFTNSLLLQDNSSETELNPTQQRVKRTRKLQSFETSYKTEREVQSSVSDTTTEEDLAFCLMMLSRDEKWKRKKKIKGRFKCETCEKVFKSYQALGGHRASHKKKKTYNKTSEENVITEDKIKIKKLHQCPICLRVFNSGQALGGHKRSHGIKGGLSLINQIQSVNVNVKMIDLNLPATMEDLEDFQ